MRRTGGLTARVGRHRHIIAPSLGAGTVLLASAVLGPGLFPVLIGGLVWAGTYFLLKPDDPYTELRKAAADLSVDGQAIAEELGRVNARIDRLVAIVRKLDRLGPSAVPVRASLVRIVEIAQVIVDDVVRTPADFPRMRKALVHYLGHVETVADRYAYMMDVGVADADVQLRLKRGLADLELLFKDYKRRMVDDEVFDLDARLTLLEQEIASEGIDLSQTPPEQASPWTMGQATPPRR